MTRSQPSKNLGASSKRKRQSHVLRSQGKDVVDMLREEKKGQDGQITVKQGRAGGGGREGRKEEKEDVECFKS